MGKYDLVSLKFNLTIEGDSAWVDKTYIEIESILKSKGDLSTSAYGSLKIEQDEDERKIMQEVKASFSKTL